MKERPAVQTAGRFGIRMPEDWLKGAAVGERFERYLYYFQKNQLFDHRPSGLASLPDCFFL